MDDTRLRKIVDDAFSEWVGMFDAKLNRDPIRYDRDQPAWLVHQQRQDRHRHADKASSDGDPVEDVNRARVG